MPRCVKSYIGDWEVAHLGILMIEEDVEADPRPVRSPSRSRLIQFNNGARTAKRKDEN